MTALLIFGAISYVIAFTVGGMLWRAYVGAKLWLWFVVPQFGLAPMPIVTAIGLSTLVSLYSTHYPDQKDDEPANTMVKGLGKVFLMPAISLLTGWIVMQYR